MQQIHNDTKTILDKIKEIFSIKTDTELAKKLNITKSFMSRLRAGQRTFSTSKMKEIEALLHDKGYVTSSFIPQVEKNSNQDTPFDGVVLDEAIRHKVIERAGGKCQLCGSSAPFCEVNGRPYLIVKSIVQLQSNQSIQIPLLYALCPNCSERIRVLQDTSDIEFLKLLLPK